MNLCKQCNKDEINSERSICKCTICLDKNKEIANRYYHKNKEQVLSKQREDRKKNPEKFAERRKKWRNKNLEKVRQYHKKWYSVPENREKALAKAKEYGMKNREKASLKKKRCRHKKPEQYAEAKRKRRNKNIDKSRADTRKYNRRRRAKLYNLTESFSEDEWNCLLKQYNYKCLCCGRNDVKLEADHVIPISREGRNIIDNIQPLCRSCNAKKFTEIIDYRPGSEEAFVMKEKGSVVGIAGQTNKCVFVLQGI